jgi:hypothetical protein
VSALFSPLSEGPDYPAPPLFHDSPYAHDAADSLDLLRTVCEEQRARLRTLLLVRDYLPTHSGRGRRALVREQESLQDLYDATWTELACAFAPNLVAWAQASVEDSLATAQQLSLF